MNHSTTIWRWINALAPPLIAALVMGCYASDPLGPLAAGNLQAAIFDTQTHQVPGVVVLAKSAMDNHPASLRGCWMPHVATALEA